MVSQPALGFGVTFYPIIRGLGVSPDGARYEISDYRRVDSPSIDHLFSGSPLAASLVEPKARYDLPKGLP
jgi:hypothetical protein